MTQPITNANSREIQTYREMAEKCRKLATVSRRPNPLLSRAQTFEEAAIALERGGAPVNVAAD